MGSWQPFGYRGKPGTCLWCGRKLRRQKVTDQAEKARLIEQGMPWWEADDKAQVPAEKAGAYQDDAFDTMSCGLLFGERMAELGHRLQFPE